MASRQERASKKEQGHYWVRLKHWDAGLSTVAYRGPRNWYFLATEEWRAHEDVEVLSAKITAPSPVYWREGPEAVKRVVAQRRRDIESRIDELRELGSVHLQESSG